MPMKTFPTIQELDRHSSVHRTVEFLCNYCDETFSNQESLDSHSASHTTLSCSITTVEECQNPLEQSNVISLDEDAFKFVCDICNFHFTDASTLHSHKESQHVRLVQRDSSNETEVKKSHLEVLCPFCRLQLQDLSMLKEHIISLHTEVDKNYDTSELCKKCDHCDFVSGNVRELETHVGECHEYRCKTCNIPFSDSSVLETHEKELHTDNQLVRCQYCNLTLPSEDYLEYHLEEFHVNEHTTDVSSVEFECNVCNYSTKLYTDLLQHKASHGESAKNTTGNDLLLNIIITQQKEILKQMDDNRKWIDKEFNDMRINQDHIFDSVKLVKSSINGVKLEINEKIDKVNRDIMEKVTKKAEEISNSAHPTDQQDNITFERITLFRHTSIKYKCVSVCGK